MVSSKGVLEALAGVSRAGMKQARWLDPARCPA
jgi:hypothetical protein